MLRSCTCAWWGRAVHACITERQTVRWDDNSSSCIYHTANTTARAATAKSGQILCHCARQLWRPPHQLGILLGE